MTDFQTGCEQGCINTDGSYICTCSSFYTLGNDGHSCDGLVSFAGGVTGISGFFLLVVAILATCFIVFLYRARRKSTETQVHGDPRLVTDTPDHL